MGLFEKVLVLVLAASAAGVGACEAVSGLEDLSVSQVPSSTTRGGASDSGVRGDAGGDASAVADAADSGDSSTDGPAGE